MILSDKKEGKILVLGHRGSPKKEIENTIPSFLQAIKDGADGVELDVRVTRDNALVVSHDNSLKRVYGVDKCVEDLTLSEIREFAPNIPKLSEVFDAVGPVYYDIEIKADSPLHFNRLVVTLLNEEIEKRPEFKEKIMLSSFNPIAMHLAAKVTKKQFPMAVIYDDNEKSTLPKPLRHGGGRFFFKCTFLKPRYDIAVREKRSKMKYPVCPWTVDTEDDLKEMVTINCPLVISNKPELMVKTLTQLGRR